MKYISNKIVCGALSMFTLLGTTSCGNDFLKEDAGHLYSDALLEDESGALKMAAGLYGNIRWHFGYEWAYGITLYGCDEFTNGADLTAEPWNTYDNRLNPQDCTPALGAANKNCPAVSALWDQMYYGISTANLIISKADNVTKEDSRNKALGEAHFLRGYNYYRLFCQYGGVVLETEPANGTVKKSFTRASEEETLNLIIDDFEKAYQMLPKDKWRGNGTWTKYTAAHFLAKALLYRQSERCASWASSYDKSADLNRAISLCDEVIAACPLAPDYWDLYAKWTGIDCPNEGLSEILMAAEHNEDKTTQGRFGNRTYNYFDPQFSNFSGGWVQRGQYIGGMDFQRCRPTEYAYSVYDNVNDARMWKTFKTVYGLNHAAKKDADVISQNGITADQVPDLGDEGIIFILNKKSDARFDGNPYGTFGRGGDVHSFVNPLTGKWVPNAFVTFQDGKYVLNTYTGNPSTSNVFCGINKTADGSRTGEKGDAHRDVIMARSGETYLVKAECQVRMGNYQEAINTVNVLRARGQWKKGEDRSYYTDGSMAFLKSDGGITDNSTAASITPKKNKDKDGKQLTNAEAYAFSMTHTNTYYLSTGIAETTDASDLQIKSYTQLPAEDEAILKEIGATSDYDRMLNFVFNERTRELLGEWNRWDELARTGLLVKRAKAFNPEAAPNVQDRHMYRPIPQKFIDTLQNEDGTNLSDADKKAWQNPGY
ncbi:RagB/SusD family nutrient uptake outer membrane protein [Xylanibacter ruminicola]|uniref:RagB/SusD family nutrient uptake outer membrane protein n=1 Tax=Xylanibacter ruminicola TaxID=839 RepID=UPI00049170EA|nr:RagB/SusD family nutrient uptake outer membrane protein [Xylanibacter ruminicola]